MALFYFNFSLVNIEGFFFCLFCFYFRFNISEIFFFCTEYKIGFYLFIYYYLAIHFLPIVTAKKADSKARIYGFKFVFFWKTKNRNHIPSWNVVIIQQENAFIKGLDMSLVHSTYSVSMSEY